MENEHWGHILKIAKYCRYYRYRLYFKSKYNIVLILKKNIPTHHYSQVWTRGITRSRSCCVVYLWLSQCSAVDNARWPTRYAVLCSPPSNFIRCNLVTLTFNRLASKTCRCWARWKLRFFISWVNCWRIASCVVWLYRSTVQSMLRAAMAVQDHVLARLLQQHDESYHLLVRQSRLQARFSPHPAMSSLL